MTAAILGRGGAQATLIGLTQCPWQPPLPTAVGRNRRYPTEVDNVLWSLNGSPHAEPPLVRADRHAAPPQRVLRAYGCGRDAG